ncbi:diguanylate cyclase [Kineococcus sp. SYSU DK006]|uniref:GGDEF domain-containing protein n=1 Tax=Kineococcus sp. SYSU DK006 TaxID=3383127 RepID=UPI003D7CC271
MPHRRASTLPRTGHRALLPLVATALVLGGAWTSAAEYRSTAVSAPATASLAALSSDGGGVFDSAVLVPGQPQSRCVRVSLAGGGSSPTARLVLSATDIAGPLAPHLRLTVDAAADPSCTRTTGRLHDGDLAALATAGPEGTSTDLVLTDGTGSATYLFTAEVDDTAEPGSSAQARFVWTATSTAGEEVVLTPTPPTPVTAPPATDPPETSSPETPAAPPSAGPPVTAPAPAPSRVVAPAPSTAPSTAPVAPPVAAPAPSSAPTRGAANRSAPAAAPTTASTTAPTTAPAGAGVPARTSAATGGPGGRGVPTAGTSTGSAGRALAAAPAPGGPAATPTAAPATTSAPGRASAPGAREGASRRSLPQRVGEAVQARVSAVLGVLPPAMARTVRGVARHGEFPLLLLLVVVLFLALQDHLDRRDPKLALAPLHPDPPLAFPAPTASSTPRPRGADVPRTSNPPPQQTEDRPPRRTGTAGLLSLQDRLRWIGATRAVVTVAPLLAALLSPSPAGGAWPLLVTAAVLHGATVALVPLLRWAPRRTAQLALGAALLADGTHLAWALRCLGGLDGPVPFIVLFHVLAVTLLASFRTGVKVALWQVLVGLVVVEGDAAGLFGPPLLEPDLPRLALAGAVLLALTLATATFAAVNERELRRRRHDADVLHRFALALEDCDSTVAAGEVLLELACAELPARRAVVVLLDAEPAGTTASGADPAVTAQVIAARPPVDSPGDHAGDHAADHAGDHAGQAGAAVGTAVRERRPVLLAQLDAAQDPWLDRLLPVARGVAVLPFGHPGGLTGALVVEHAGTARGSRRRLDRRALRLAEQATAHAGQAVGRTELVARLREAAETDALTGLRNRRALDELLVHRFADAAARAGTCAVLVLDLDHFKALNDTHGHQAGDEALRAVGQLLRADLREGTVAARYGGEEFCVLAPDLAPAEALALGERLRARVQAVTGTAAPLTVSIGVASFPQDGDDVAPVLAAADAALYRAKAAGRDRVVGAGAPAGSVPRLPTGSGTGA